MCDGLFDGMGVCITECVTGSQGAYDAGCVCVRVLWCLCSSTRFFIFVFGTWLKMPKKRPENMR